MFILPGGIAEVYTSCPKTHVVVFKERKGLVRLTLEVGAQLTPIYVFGGTDFFYNVVAGDNLIAKLARRLRMGLTLFYGPCFLPLPFTPRVTFCYGEPLPVIQWDPKKGAIPNELVEEMHDKVREKLQYQFPLFIMPFSICGP